MIRPRTTRTLGPLHFEDLEPHRFEDLVRELTYDYKDWQSIEATGRSGSDEGWDIRAYEKARTPEAEPDEDETPESVHPMEGNAWMFQVKREKTIGPADVKRIVGDVNSEDPPYGYILAAPTSFSKRSYDVFRAELRGKGVREFYIWGRAELEDMLHLPKNDRILFTFFGISLVSRRRSRSVEVKAGIAAKNKLYRAIGEGGQLYKTILLRDLADNHYPYANQYPDFEENRRWRQLTAAGHHPLGLWLHSHRYYAYVDQARREWDYTSVVDLRDDEQNFRQSDEEREKFQKKQQLVIEAWEFLPKARQGILTVDALLPYANIAAIDEKGDVLYNCPHIFVDYGGRGPYAAWLEVLEVRGEKVRLTNDFKRVGIFSKRLVAEPYRTASVSISLDELSLNEFREYKDVGALYADDRRYENLKAKDVVSINGIAPEFDREPLFQITYIGRGEVGAYLKEAREPFKFRRAIQLQLGRDVGDDEIITYLEYKRYYKQAASDKVPVIGVPEE